MSKPIKVQVLGRAVEIISDPNCWCQIMSHVVIDDEDKYCAQGAIWQAIKEMMPDWLNSDTAFKIYHELLDSFGTSCVPGNNSRLWVTNDLQGREAVIERMKNKSKELVNV